MAESVHGKVLSLDAATRLIQVDEDLDLRDLEQVIPYSQARDIVLRNPSRIVAIECPCRAARPNPCLPTDVCLIVGEPFASEFAERHPGRTRWITQAMAVEILRSEHARGHVHHAFFKDAMLGRYYAICNCCSCCCGPMEYWRHGTPMLASSGYVANVDGAACIGCGRCESRCQFGAISLVDGSAVVDDESCMGCGVCETTCVDDAIRLERREERGVPLEIWSLDPVR
jgi:ferredoxin